MRELVGRQVQAYDDHWPLDPIGSVEQVAADPQLRQREREVAGQARQSVRFLGHFGHVP